MPFVVKVILLNLSLGCITLKKKKTENAENVEFENILKATIIDSIFNNEYAYATYTIKIVSRHCTSFSNSGCQSRVSTNPSSSYSVKILLKSDVFTYVFSCSDNHISMMTKQ